MQLAATATVVLPHFLSLKAVAESELEEDEAERDGDEDFVGGYE